MEGIVMEGRQGGKIKENNSNLRKFGSKGRKERNEGRK